MKNGILLLTFFYASIPFFSEAGNALEIGRKGVPDSTTSKSGNIEGFDKFIYNSSNSKWKFGLRFGGNINKQIVEDSPVGMVLDPVEPRAGIHGGLILDRSWRNWSLQPGLFITQKGSGNRQSELRVRTTHLEFPLQINYLLFETKNQEVTKGLSIFLAPYSSYLIRSTVELEGAKLRIGLKETGFNRWDYGLRSGVDFHVGSFDFLIGYEHGLKNLGNEFLIVKNRGFFFNVGLVFGR
jgi:hypothetical protein